MFLRTLTLKGFKSFLGLVSAVIIDFAGEPSALTVVQDITQRKHSEHALQASEKKYRSLVGNIPEAVWIANADRELIYISDNIDNILGYRSEELLRLEKTLWLDRVHPTTREYLRSHRKKYHSFVRKTWNYNT